MNEITLETILAGAIMVPAIQRGVYFLIKDGAVVYIGQSPVNVYRRVGEHIRTKDIDAYYCHPFEGSQSELDLLERRLIDTFNPPLNKHKRFWQNIPEGGGHESNATKRALTFVSKGSTPYAAAKRANISLSTIYRALKRQRSRNA